MQKFQAVSTRVDKILGKKRLRHFFPRILSRRCQEQACQELACQEQAVLIISYHGIMATCVPLQDLCKILANIVPRTWQDIHGGSTGQH